MKAATYKRERVVKVRKSGKMVETYYVQPGSSSLGIERDGSGRLYLTRASRDGIVQLFELLNASGNPIRCRKLRGKSR